VSGDDRPGFDRPSHEEVHILWMSAGLGCDGDSVSLTAATNPSLEDIVLGAIPGLPRVHLHHPLLLNLLMQMAGLTGEMPLDELGRPAWLFNVTAREGCNRAGSNEHADFATDYNSGKCLARLGCWGPVVDCNVGKRGWMSGIGGCANVGGICIGCTMPGFPDRFMPFMDAPLGGQLTADLLRPHGAAVRTLRLITNAAIRLEPEWRRPGPRLTTGYEPDAQPA
jgi:hydrogenase small subunit